MKEIKELIREYVERNGETRISYDIDRRVLEINGREYSVGKLLSLIHI